MNRTTLLACASLFACFASAQDLSKKISVEIPAAKASVVLAQLSKASGVSMEAAGNVRDDVFVVSARDCTVDDVMKRIAQAEGGRWERNGSLYLLERDSSVTVTQERQELKARAALIASAIAKLSSSSKNDTKFDAGAAKKLAQQAHETLDQIGQGNGPGGVRRLDLNPIISKTPASRAITRLLATIDPAALAQVGPGQRIVFSTNPTPMQRPLGGAGTDAFRDFIAEQQLYVQAYTETEPQDANNKRMVMVNGFGTPSMGSGNPQLGLGIGLVIVQRRLETGLTVDIIAADPNLATIASGSTTLQLPSPPEAAPGPAQGEEPLKISDLAKEMTKALRGAEGAANSPRAVKAFAVTTNSDGGSFFVTSGSGAGGEKIKISAELRAKLLDPEHFDPLSFAPGEAMLALARQTNHNLVALLPDYCFGSLTREMAADITPSQLLAKLGPQHSLDPKVDGDWLVVAPSMPYGARANRVNRSALGTLVRTLDKQGLRLDDVAAFALAQDKTPGYNDADMVYPRLIDAPVADRMLTPLAAGSYSLYKFYGSLSAGQRQTIAAGNQIPFSNLSPQQLALIGDMLYNSPQGPDVDLGDQQRQGQGTKTVSTTVLAQSGPGVPIFFGGGATSAKTERTIVAPNGINNGGVMLSNVSNQSLYQAMNSQTGATEFVDANTLGFQKGTAGSPAFADADQPQYDRFRPAKQSTINFRFVINQQVMVPRSLQDQWLDDNSDGVPYEQLPADFRKQVEDAAQRMKNTFGKVPGIGRQTPPPPRAQ